MPTFAAMFIAHITKTRRCPGADNLFVGYRYYRLMEAYRDESGRPSKRMVMGLGELKDTTKADRDELARLLEVMMNGNELPITDNSKAFDIAMHFYAQYRQEKIASESRKREQEALREAAEAKRAKEREEYVCMKIKSLRMSESRTVGAETLALWAADKLGMRQTLLSLGFGKEEADMGLMQIVARAVYPGSELRTARCLRENSALCELVGVPAERINKDRLYRSARRLWDVHRELEDRLHQRVCNLFNLDEKIYLFDLTNTYFEGRMDTSNICRYGNSKEKRTDCKIVALAAVVNTDGLLVRTDIFEGNIQDAKTLEGVIGSVEKGLAPAKRIVVIDAGFCTESNLKWLKDNGYDYITVMRSRGKKWTPLSDVIVSVNDNKRQRIRLQKVLVEGVDDTVLLVDSDGKAMKERSMADKARRRYEDGLRAIQNGILGKGTKKRDALQRRLGRLQEKYPGVCRCYEVEFEYDDNDRATAMNFHAKDDTVGEKHIMHGKYLLQTSIDKATAEEAIWTYYNIIRVVEETFKTLKADLDMRPVFHKTDDGTKAHLNLAVLAYWLVSTIRYVLRSHDIDVRWEEILRIGSAQVRVTAQFETKDERTVSVRKNTDPETKMMELYTALGIKPQPRSKIKFVGHPKSNQKKAPPDLQAIM